MRRFVLSMLALLAMQSVSSQDRLNVGYSYGQVATQSNYEVSGKTWVDAAIYLPPTKIKMYKGSRIVEIDAGLASRVNIDSLRVWIRTSLTGPNLVEKSLSKEDNPKIIRGWNKIQLDQPYEINSEEGLYIGYSFKQRDKTKATAVIDEPQKDAFWLRLGSTSTWEDKSAEGALSLEAVFEGNKLPQYDLGLVSAVAVPELASNTIKITAKVRNYAVKTIQGFTLSTSLPDGSLQVSNQFDNALASNGSTEVTYSIPDVNDAGIKQPIEIKISALKNGTDENEANNMQVPSYSFTHKVLVEEFTTEQCPNCPRVSNYLHEVLSEPKYKDNVIAVCHHSGYHTDWLTQECDNGLLFLYNLGGSTFAPGVMFDRYPFFSRDGAQTAVVSPDKQELITYIEKRLAEKARASLNLRGYYDENAHKLNIEARGKRSEDFSKTPARLTVYLLEDNIKANKQAGAPTFTHQHVIRAFNSTWGDVVEWENNRFLNTYSFQVDDSWKKSNMYIVAFIGDYDSTKPANCVIENAESISFNALVTNIEQTTTSKVVARDYYTINGVKTAEDRLTKGVYIIRTTTSDGRVSSQKVLIP